MVTCVYANLYFRNDEMPKGKITKEECLQNKKSNKASAATKRKLSRPNIDD